MQDFQDKSSIKHQKAPDFSEAKELSPLQPPFIINNRKSACGDLFDFISSCPYTIGKFHKPAFKLLKLI